MGLKKTITATVVMILCNAALSYGSWQGPAEILSGGWGKGNTNFGIESGDTSDRFPSLAAILFDGRIVISDQVNEREVIYKNDGTLLKIVPWYIYQNSTKTMNPEYPTNQYWNVQGYTPEGNVWIEIGNTYALKSPTGQTIKTSATEPLELGVVSTKTIAKGQYKITVTYPDKVWTTIASYSSATNYIRDAQGRIYRPGTKQIVRFNDCGREITRLSMPVKKIVKGESQGEGTEPRITVLEEYGSPVLAPNGDVYTWKRTPDKYSIVKWTWVDDPKSNDDCSPNGSKSDKGVTKK